ncbi:TerB family tellurite resistance protein [Robertkochia aurantiaca]|uniref:TerB family tellurite resistance protein n=1 Tax=Robertkochia aurantiaca TaxID=2873700 RepID=UPI001CCF6617|nr:TerB family tellurite resistance protein [Robertkochia sp. 3YJGBD-33]
MWKWIVALCGYMFFRLPGALIGFLLGSMLENMMNGSGTTRVFGNQEREVSPADFELHLISLCSIVIKADGSVSQSELDYVRRYFLTHYGKEKANAIFRTFNEVVKKREISAYRICMVLNQRTRYAVRLQLLHFLFDIARADGAVSKAEAEKIEEIAGYLNVAQRDFVSIKAMFVDATGNAYKILEIDEQASEEEVKQAYRKMVKKYHPDKVRTTDEAIKRGAEEKFREVQKAYEQIQSERGF